MYKNKQEFKKKHWKKKVGKILQHSVRAKIMKVGLQLLRQKTSLLSGPPCIISKVLNVMTQAAHHEAAAILQKSACWNLCKPAVTYANPTATENNKLLKYNR